MATHNNLIKYPKHLINFLSSLRDSNTRSFAYKANALTNYAKGANNG
jgi:hypothetical protein